MRLTIQHIHTYERLTRTPSEAAALVASGCGCETEAELASQGSFAVADPEAPASEVTWHGVLTVEGLLTGDGRMLEGNSMTWENLPLPLRYAPVDTGGHQGAQVVGRILTIAREKDGKISATGDFDMSSPLGPEAARVVKTGTERGVSVDLDDVSFEIRVAKELLGFEDPEAATEIKVPEEDADGRVTVMEIKSDDEIMVTTSGRIRAATIVSIPAFIDAALALDDETIDLDAAASQVVQEAEAIVAGAAPMEPPAAWFADPQLPGPTPLTITEDGRIYGHLAVWGTCHTAYSGQCVEPPHSNSDYAFFKTGAVLTSDGHEVAVGGITIDTLHAGRDLGPADTLSHYEHTGRRAADVAAGEDAFGIWVAGAIRPSVRGEKLRALRAAPISGDWRRIGGNLELVAALAVNSPGFPVPRPKGLVASGGVMVSLVASGMMAPRPATAGSVELSSEDLAFIRKLRAREEADRSKLQSQADQIAARVRGTRAAQLAKRAGVR